MRATVVKHANNTSRSWAHSILVGLLVLALLGLFGPTSSYRSDPQAGVSSRTLGLGFSYSQWLIWTRESTDWVTGQGTTQTSIELHPRPLAILSALYLLAYLSAPLLCRRLFGRTIDDIWTDYLNRPFNQRIAGRLVESRYFEAERRLLWRSLMVAGGVALAVNMILATPYRYTIEFLDESGAADAQAVIAEALASTGRKADIRVIDSGPGSLLVIEGREHGWLWAPAIATWIAQNDRVSGSQYTFGHRLHPWTLWAAGLAFLLALALGRNRRKNGSGQPLSA